MEELGDKYECAWERQCGGATELASDLSRISVLERPGTTGEGSYLRSVDRRSTVKGTSRASVPGPLPCILDEDVEGRIQSIVDALPSSLDEDIGSSALLSVVDALPSTLDDDVQASGHGFGASQSTRGVEFCGLMDVAPVQVDASDHSREHNCRSGDHFERRPICEPVFIPFCPGVYSGPRPRASEELKRWETNPRFFTRGPGIYPGNSTHPLVLPDNGRQGFPCVPTEAYLGIPVHPSSPLIASSWTHMRPHPHLTGRAMHDEEWRTADSCSTAKFRPVDMTRDGDMRALPIGFAQYTEKTQPLLQQLSLNSNVYNLEMSCHPETEEEASRDEDTTYPSANGFYGTMHGTRVAEVALDVERRKVQQLSTPPWDQATANHLSMLLSDIFSGLQPKEYDYHMRMHLVQRLTNFCQLLEDCKGAVIVPFGSFESNFFTPWGDLDLSLEFPLVGPVSKSKRVKLLKCLERELGRSGTVRKLRFISHARVPLVMFVDTQSGISCDVSVDNGIGLFKSRVLRWICDIDLRCRQLIYLVKCWAKAQGINEPKLGTLNSFAISLLVVFHLQTRSPPILPALGTILGEDKRNELPGKWTGSLRDQHLEECSKRIQALIGGGYGQQNKSTVPELLLSFFSQFSAVRNLWTQGLVVRTFAGQWGDNGTSTQAWKDKHYIMNVEDPFDYTENCARSVHENSLPIICDAFASTTDALLGLQPDSDLSWLRVCLFCWPQGNLVPGVRSKMQQQFGQQYGQMYGQPNGQFRQSAYGQQFPSGRNPKGGWNQHQQLQDPNKLDFFGTQGKGRHDAWGLTQAKSGIRNNSMEGKSEGALQPMASEQHRACSASEDERSYFVSDNDSGDQSMANAKLKPVKPKIGSTTDKVFPLLTVESQAPQGNQVDHLQQSTWVGESSGASAVAATFLQVYKRERHRNRGRRKGKQQEFNGQAGVPEDPSHLNYDVNASRNPQQGRNLGKPSGNNLRPGETSSAQRSQVGGGTPQSPESASTGGKASRKNKQHFPRWTKKNQEMGNTNPLHSNAATVLGDQGCLPRQDGQIPPRRGNFRILVGPGVPDSKLGQSSPAHS